MELFVVGIFFALLWIGWEVHSLAAVAVRLMWALENGNPRHKHDMERAA